MKKLLLLLVLTPMLAQAEEINRDYISTINSKIEKECMSNSWSWEVYFEDSMWVRCTLILQWLTQFETNFLRDYKNNNIFNFRGWEWMLTIRDKWKNLWVVWYSNRFLVFDNVDSSIRFAVDRFFTYDRYKTIKQIIFWGLYISPVDWELKVFDWFTMTIEHRPNYYKFLKNYYSENIWKQ